MTLGMMRYAYAQNKDYHKIIKGKLKNLASWIVSKTHGEIKVFVDTAPLMEKPLAEAAGLGWQGKHTNLVSSNFGSWLFLGIILIDADLQDIENKTISWVGDGNNMANSWIHASKIFNFKLKLKF